MDERVYLRHVIETVEDVLASLLRTDVGLCLMLLRTLTAKTPGLLDTTRRNYPHRLEVSLTSYNPVLM